MTDAELIALAVKMRDAQKAYFKTHDRAALITSKQLEAQFDKAAAAREAAPVVDPMERAAKLAETRSTQVWDGCENLGPMDMETGSRDCALETRGGSCLCQERFEALDALASELRKAGKSA